MNRKTITEIKAAKNAEQPMVWLTAYTAPMAKILDAHCDVMLVGDSIGMVLYGMENTLDVSLEIMIAHGRAVVRQAQHAAIIIDMPYGTYEHDKDVALKNARRVISETGCDGVKLEGGADLAPTVAYLSANGVAVMGHIGLLPQAVEKEGGYKVKGKTEDDATRLIADAQALEAAGAFAFVIEGTIEDVSRRITQSVNIPTIGIGASAACDGQVLVTDDMLGLLQGHTPKFVKKYEALSGVIDKAVASYAADVRARKFPSAEYTYTVKK